MKSLSEYMTESLVNEAADKLLKDLKDWAGSYFVFNPDDVNNEDPIKNDALRSIKKDLVKIGTALRKVSEVKTSQHGMIAALTLANYIVNVIPYNFLAEDIEEWMEIVGADFEGDEFTDWLADLYERIKKDSGGKIDPMEELA